MNIVDYETDEGNEDHERYKKELESRGMTPAQFLERKRKARQPGGANKTIEVCCQPQIRACVYLLFEFAMLVGCCDCMSSKPRLNQTPHQVAKSSTRKFDHIPIRTINLFLLSKAEIL
jgi:hypothetical protein